MIQKDFFHYLTSIFVSVSIYIYIYIFIQYPNKLSHNPSIIKKKKVIILPKKYLSISYYAN